jgi:branched-chain amino acid transport system permease protein
MTLPAKLQSASRSERFQLGSFGLVLLVLVIWAQVSSPSMLDVTTLALLFLMLGLGMNIILGWTGLLHLGYVALYGLGAYLIGLLMRDHNVQFLLAIAICALAGIGVSILMGLLTLRLRGDYFLVVTLAFAEIFALGVVNLSSITGGPQGFYGVPAPVLLGKQFVSTYDFYYLVLGATVIGFLIALALRQSALVQSWVYVRFNEYVSEILGVPTVRAKLLSVVIGSCYASVAGGLLAVKLSTVGPESFTFSQTVTILLVVLVGGMGGLWGLLAGVLLIAFLPNAISVAPEYQLLAFGIGLIIIMLLRPAGVVPAKLGITFVGDFVRKRRGIASTPPPATKRSAELEPVTAEVVGATEEALLDAGGVRVATTTLPVVSSRQEAARERNADALVALEGVTVRFSGVVALNDVSMQVRSREILGLIGPNGSGKTTAFNAVTGVVSLSAGSITVDSKRIDGLAPHAIAQLGIARTFQETRLFEDLTVLDNVRAGCRDQGGFWRVLLPRRERRVLRGELEAAKEAMDIVSPHLFERYADRPAGELPFAQRRLVEVARALCGKPKLILLDEPAAGLDTDERQLIVEIVRRIRDLGTTVWLVEHDMRLIAALADRVVAFLSGKVVAEGNVQSVTSDEAVLTAYLGGHRR